MNHMILRDSCGLDDDLGVDPAAYSMPPTSPNPHLQKEGDDLDLDLC